MAHEIAAAAPLAVVSLRQTLRMGLAERVRAAAQREQQQSAGLASSRPPTPVRGMSAQLCPAHALVRGAR